MDGEEDNLLVFSLVWDDGYADRDRDAGRDRVGRGDGGGDVGKASYSGKSKGKVEN